MDERVDEREEPVVKKKLLSALDILDANDVKTEDVDVPEWGGVVRLRSLSADEMSEFIDKYGKDKNKGEAVVKALQLSAIGEDGQNLFPINDDVETRKIISRLRRKSLRAFMRVQSAVLKLNGLSVEEEATAKND